MIESTQSPGKRPKLRVLVIDESPATLEIVRRELQQADWIEIVAEAITSQNALGLFFQLKPHAVIVSTCLSVQSGLEVLRCIRRAFATCPVIVTIRQRDEFVTEAARLLGATAVCCLAQGPTPLMTILGSLNFRSDTGDGLLRN